MIVKVKEVVKLTFLPPFVDPLIVISFNTVDWDRCIREDEGKEYIHAPQTR